MLDALRTAAAALLNAAPEPLVRHVLRELLAEDAKPASRTLPTPVCSDVAAPVRANGTGSKPAMDRAAWDELRQQVRARMRAEGLTYRSLGPKLRQPLRPGSLEDSLCRSKPPSAPIIARLQRWLRQGPANGASDVPAPEVAAAASTFRGGTANGASRVHTADPAGTASPG